jgi:hypothetical protein
MVENKDTHGPTPECKAFGEKVLAIMEKRQLEARVARANPLNEGRPIRNFTREQLRLETAEDGEENGVRGGFDLYYYLYGSAKNLPNRKKILAIARYLECSVSELNELLFLADYQQVEPFFSEDELSEILHSRKYAIQQYFMYPTAIFNRDWNVIEYNDSVYTFLNIPATTLNSLRFPFNNILHMIFYNGPGALVRPILEQVSYDAWYKTAQQWLELFLLDNRIYANQEWYKKLFFELEKIPDFNKIYQSITAADTDIPREYIMKFMTPLGIARVRVMFIRMSYYLYPQVVSVTPDNAETRAIFIDLNIGTSVNP